MSADHAWCSCPQATRAHAAAREAQKAALGGGAGFHRSQAAAAAAEAALVEAGALARAAPVLEELRTRRGVARVHAVIALWRPPDST